MNKYYHISFNCKERPVPHAAINDAFNKAKDWIQYVPNCWLIYTSLSTEDWYKRMRKILHPDDSFMIIEVSIKSRNGWMPKDVWAWVDKDR